jgi:hypothetical protein
LAEFRPSLTDEGASGQEVEVFLYDTLPGGAGFSTSLISRADELFESALDILSNCPANCETSCYRCLRSFRNRIEHSLLDRQLGIQFLRHTLFGGYPEYPSDRIKSSIELLARDLQRQFGHELEISTFTVRADPKTGKLKIPLIVTTKSNEVEHWVTLSSPIAPTRPASLELHSMSEGNLSKLKLVSDILVRRNIAKASLTLRDSLD